MSEQTGPLFMQGNKFPTASVWMPNWLFDVVCVSADLAKSIGERFDVRMGEVFKPRSGPTGAKQLLPTLTRDPWYERKELSTAVRARHGKLHGDQTGSTCTDCQRWKWLPVGEGRAPLRAGALVADSDMISSPEYFGDGWSSFHQLLFRRPLGELLVAASPRTWYLVEVEVA